MKTSKFVFEINLPLKKMAMKMMMKILCALVQCAVVFAVVSKVFLELEQNLGKVPETTGKCYGTKMIETNQSISPNHKKGIYLHCRIMVHFAT